MILTLLALFLPFLTGLLALVISGRGRQITVLLGSLATFAVAMLLPSASGIEVPWFESLGIYFSVSPAGAGSVLVLVASLVMIPTAYYAATKVEERTGAFVALLLAMQTGLNGIFMAQDLVLYYIFWEATLIPSVLMLGGWGLERRQQAALKYLTYAVAGSFLMLVAILALRPISGAASFRMVDLLAVTPQLPFFTQLWLFIGFALAFAVKHPLWPLHAWLPHFHEQNHPSGAADVAGTLYKVGGWGFFAFALPLFPDAAAAASPILVAVAAFTALYAAMIATAQTNLKRLLAYASLSHMGIVGVGIFGLNIAGLNGAIYLLAAQMVSTGGLFLLSGMLYERRGSFELDDYGGLAKGAPALAAITLFVMFASIGVPGLGNFPGEFMALMGAFQTAPYIAGFATLAVIAAGVYGVNMYQRLYQGEQKGEVWDMGRLELLILAPLLAGIVWLGVTPQPQLERIERQSRIVLTQLEAQQRVNAEGERLELVLQEDVQRGQD